MPPSRRSEHVVERCPEDPSLGFHSMQKSLDTCGMLVSLVLYITFCWEHPTTYTKLNDDDLHRALNALLMLGNLLYARYIPVKTFKKWRTLVAVLFASTYTLLRLVHPFENAVNLQLFAADPLTDNTKIGWILRPLRLCLATGTVLMATHPFMYPLPLAFELLLAPLRLYSIHANKAFCKTALALNPSTQQNIASVSRFLESVPLALLPGPPIKRHNTFEQCIALTTFVRVLFGVFFPLICLVKLAPPLLITNVYESKLYRRVTQLLCTLCTPSKRLQRHLYNAEMLDKRGMDLDDYRRSGWDGDLSELDLKRVRRERDSTVSYERSRDGSNGADRDSMPLDMLSYVQRGLNWLGLVSMLWLWSVILV